MKIRLLVFIVILVYWSYYSINFQYNAEHMQRFFETLGYTVYVLLGLCVFEFYKVVKNK